MRIDLGTGLSLGERWEPVAAGKCIATLLEAVSKQPVALPEVRDEIGGKIQSACIVALADSENITDS